MKQFHVYGIGNALLDIDFEVSTETLARLNIAKGVMTLIDEKTHHYLLEELDGIKHLKACGGSAANTLFTLQQLGAKSYYSCKVGNDEAGDFFYHNLIANGIHTNLQETTRIGLTGKCIVLVTPDADRTMNTFLGVTAEFSIAELSETALKNAEYLYIEGYLVASNPGCEAAILAHKLAQKHHIKTALSLSDPNMVTYFKAGLLSIIGHQVDILFCNDKEALLFTESTDLTTAQEKLKKIAHTFVITLGAEGALVYDGEKTAHISAYKADAIDTVGAGDVFSGTFLYGMTHGLNYFSAADVASFAAAKVVAKFGPRLNEKEIHEVQTFLAKQPVYG